MENNTNPPIKKPRIVKQKLPKEQEDLIRKIVSIISEEKSKNGEFNIDNLVKSKVLKPKKVKKPVDPNKPKKPRKQNPWIAHLNSFRSSHPELSFKDATIEAKKTYIQK